MAELADWMLVAAALAATAVTVLPRSGRPGARTVQAMGFLLLSVVVSLVWLRLSSVDVALAEAGLGGGLLGAVLVVIAAAPRRREALTPRGRAWLAPTLGTAAGAALTVVLAAVWVRVEQTMPEWTQPLQAQMPIGGTGSDGVAHEITGVLLAFRAYDTLLESGVLMMAGVAALALRREAAPSAPLGRKSAAAPVPPVLSAGTDALVWLVRVIAPVLLLAGLWLLFAGSTDSGGAFQSGAVLAAMLILLRVTGTVPDWLTAAGSDALLRLSLVIGVVVFIVAGLLGPLAGQPWLSWDGGWAFAAILTVEILLTVGIAAGLYALFISLGGADEVVQS